MGKRVMMVPSVNLRGGVVSGAPSSNAAFVKVHHRPFLQRRSTSSSSTTATSISSSSDSSLTDDSFYQESTYQQTLQESTRIVARPDEPNLFNIPSDLRPTYRPLPMLLQLFIVIVSAVLVGRNGISQLLNSSRTSIFQQLFATPLFSQRIFSTSSIRKLISFVLRTALVSTITNLSIQEVLYKPSRVTTQYLAERGILPSKLSKYTTVHPVPVSSAPRIPIAANNSDGGVIMSTSSWNEDDDDDESSLSPIETPSIGVHSIQYTQQQKNTSNNSNSNHSKHKYDGIHLHHGFGASSLSWLPVLPSLVNKIGNGNAVGVAHDAPGFGFTDRPNADINGGLYQYGYENNVGIGVALMNEVLVKKEQDTDTSMPPRSPTSVTDSNIIHDNNEANKSIAIFGHSMGSKAALLMALHYDAHPELQVKPSLVVLVAAALEGVSLPSRRGYGLKQPDRRSGNHQSKRGWIRKLTGRVWLAWRKVFVDASFQYGLRRLVW